MSLSRGEASNNPRPQIETTVPQSIVNVWSSRGFQDDDREVNDAIPESFGRGAGLSRRGLSVGVACNRVQ